MNEEARRAAERAARLSYGRLVAMLAARSGDIGSAEDALGDAFASALQTWPERGVPDNPDAWLLTAARRNLGHRRARAHSAAATMPTLLLLADERDATDGDHFGDRRLALMFACAHPAIDDDVRTPLILQAVLGLDAARIAAAFLVSPAAMGRKLSRAKLKIRDAGIPFSVPDPDKLADRTANVLAAIYAAFGTGWEDVVGADVRRQGLSGEAIWLARLVVHLLPDQPEPMGLLALMLHCEARRTTRRDAQGAFVPLHAQDPQCWSRPMIVEAEALLRTAAAKHAPGRFQTEAAIQSLHAQGRMTGEELSRPLLRLYDLLVTLTPTLGAAVARAVAYGESGAAAAGLAQLDAIAGAAQAYQPFWVARARLLDRLHCTAEAMRAVERAAGLTGDPSVREYLLSGGLFADSVDA